MAKVKGHYCKTKHNMPGRGKCYEVLCSGNRLKKNVEVEM